MSDPIFITRAEALEQLGRAAASRLRNYEIEGYMDRATMTEGHVVTDWCPFDGRFCKVAAFVPFPHPPLGDDPARPPETDVPWNVWKPENTERLR